MSKATQQQFLRGQILENLNAIDLALNNITRLIGKRYVIPADIRRRIDSTSKRVDTLSKEVRSWAILEIEKEQQMMARGRKVEVVKKKPKKRATGPKGTK